MPNLGPTELILGGFVLLVLAAIVLTVGRALSPSTERCSKILRRWGVEKPSGEQADLLAGLLVIELGAIVRPAFNGRRSAVLVRRGVTDLLPRYAIVSYGLVTVTGLASVVVNLLTPNRSWALPVGYLVLVAAAGAIVWACLFRAPLFDDAVLDAALRVRSARVSTGVSLLLLSFLSMGVLLVYVPWSAPALILIGLINWIGLLNPLGKQRLVEASK
ncbi:hypothetical protein [Flindersiella endophytica]